jgi:predicted Fe-S protein YdhL (DUF1289 family)
MLVDTIHCTHCKRQVDEEEAWDKVDDDDTVAATVVETIETDNDDANTAGTKLSTKATTTTTIDGSRNTTSQTASKSWGSWVTPKAALVAGAAVGGIGLLGGTVCVAATCYGFGAAGIVGGSSA